MSKRFANLEFDGENQREPSGEASQETRYNDEYYLGKAREARYWGEFDKALAMYTRCLEHNRALISAWVGQVQMLVELGEYQEARLWSDKALELFRDNGEILGTKAQACARLKDNRAAMACSDASLQSPGSSAWRWEARGEALLANSQDYYDPCFQKALNEPGADWFDRVVIARIYLYYQRAGNAMQYLRQAQQIEPGQGCVWLETANCQAAMGLTAAARASYERCLELRPKFRPVLQALESLQQMTFRDWLKGVLRIRKTS